MADLTATFTVTPSPALQRALAADGAALLGPALHRFLQRAGDTIKEEAQHRAEALADRAGVLAGAHHTRMDPSPIPKWLDIYVDEHEAPEAPFVHGSAADNFTWGRRPDQKMPPPEVLAGWAGRHGFETDDSTLWRLAHAIGEHGIKARPWLRDAAVAMESRVTGVDLNNLGFDLETAWSGVTLAR